MKKTYKLEGMTCASCESHVTKALKKLDDLNSFNVSLLNSSVELDFDENKIQIEKIRDVIDDAGYNLIISEEKQEQKKTKNNELVKIIISSIFTLILMYVAMGNMINLPIPQFLKGTENAISFVVTQLILTVPVILINQKYFISGFKKLFRLKPNMDSLIAIGATASILYGILAIYMIGYGLGHDKLHYVHTYIHNLYFEAAAVILTLVSLGKYFELKSKEKTTNAITKLLDLSPKQAVILVNNKEILVKIEDVKIGDILIVRKGESVSVDGVIIEGEGSLDQSNITGESLPVLKTNGDSLISSTYLVSGYIKYRATKVGNDTTINTIIKLVSEASNSKAPISKLVDKISSIFVPIVLLISLICFIIFLSTGSTFEFSLGIAISVLVISCPCALGLATPVCIMVGTGKAASNGILIKNAEIFEKSHAIKTIVFDKTGTITKGNPEVVDVVVLDDTYNIEQIAFSLESNSSHPLANSINKYVESKMINPLKVVNFNSEDSRGLFGIINNEKFYIGNIDFLNSNNINTKKIETIVLDFSNEGKTPLLLSNEKQVIGIFCVKDEIKESSANAIKRLVKDNYNIYMLTGDNENTAKKIADELGITNVIANCLPADKQKYIQQIKKETNTNVLMVGDGVNDALALTSADLSIAVSNGSEIALDASDIVLLKNDLNDISNLFKLSKRVLLTIKFNLFWAFFYNCIGIVLASGIFYYSFNLKLNPMIASLAMSFSSVFVILNALTINFYKDKK
ncbi:MAG: heavy metal translocating P-type ATPase [Anaeroplasmataceae bacterium]